MVAMLAPGEFLGSRVGGSKKLSTGLVQLRSYRPTSFCGALSLSARSFLGLEFGTTVGRVSYRRCISNWINSKECGGEFRFFYPKILECSTSRSLTRAPASYFGWTNLHPLAPGRRYQLCYSRIKNPKRGGSCHLWKNLCVVGLRTGTECCNVSFTNHHSVEEESKLHGR